MAQVTYDKLFSEARANVVALLTSSNVPDPTITSSQFRKWIYSSEPDVKSSGFKGYPVLVVNHADVDILGEEDNRGSLDGKSKPVFWSIEIEVITSDRGYGSKDGQGAAQMDSISNNIMTTFNNKTNRTTLSNQSMKFSTPTTTAVTPDVIQNEKVFRRSILLPFKSRIQVSA